MLQTFLGATIVLSALLINGSIDYPEQTRQTNPAIPAEIALQPIKTESKFSEKVIEETIVIPKAEKFIDNPETEAGDDKILDEGSNGQKITQTKITFYEGSEYSREIVDSKTIAPKDKIISRGTKVVWRNLDTPDGLITYWKKLRVWATHYDWHCLGCDEWTATGMRQGKGVVAVDPKVIKLYTKVYVPGYGLSIAGDTGGAIKGNKIDLGFEDARTAAWSARFVDIYLLN